MPPYSYTDLVKKSYELILLLQFERDRDNTYRLKSRNKVRNLATALNEFDDPSTAIPEFVRHSTDSLTHGAAAATFGAFLAKITDPADQNGIQMTINTNISAYTSEVKRNKIREIIGYTNWGTESVCAIFSAYPQDNEKVRKRLESMINAEFAVLWEKTGISDESYKKNLVNGLMNLKTNADSEFKNGRKNHV